jgi:hypothetical protein
MIGDCWRNLNLLTDTKASGDAFVQLFGSNPSGVIAWCRRSLRKVQQK